MDSKNINKRAKMESEFDMKDIIVIDNGSETVKVGISGENFPKVIILFYNFLKYIKKIIRISNII